MLHAPPLPARGEGLRYCRHCQDSIAVDLFPNGKQRYVCKLHVNARARQYRQAKQEENCDWLRAETKARQDPHAVRLAREWNMCCHDRKVFDQRRIAIEKPQLAAVIAAADPLCTGFFHAVPVNPREMLSNHNVVVVVSKVRKRLLRKAGDGLFGEYDAIVTALAQKRAAAAAKSPQHT